MTLHYQSHVVKFNYNSQNNQGYQDYQNGQNCQQFWSKFVQLWTVKTFKNFNSHPSFVLIFSYKIMIYLRHAIK